MPAYHIDIGNSTLGSVGISGVVRATSPEEARALFEELMDGEIDLKVGHPDVEYVCLYVNANNFDKDGIDVELDDIYEDD